MAADLREREAVEEFLSNASADSFRGVFEVLYNKLVHYFVIRRTDRPTAEDLTQDVLMTIYAKAGLLRNKENFFGWLFKIAANRHLQYLRSRKNSIQSVNLNSRDIVDVTQRDEQRFFESRCDFQYWMTLLEPSEREVMMLRYIEELEYQEIAAALKMPIGTVKWKLFNAKERLISQLARPTRSFD